MEESLQSQQGPRRRRRWEREKEKEDIDCFRCGEKGHYATRCPVKREKAVCTFKCCTSPNVHLLKACKNINKGQEPKKKRKGKNKEEK